MRGLFDSESSMRTFAVKVDCGKTMRQQGTLSQTACLHKADSIWPKAHLLVQVLCMDRQPGERAISACVCQSAASLAPTPHTDARWRIQACWRHDLLQWHENARGAICTASSRAGKLMGYVLHHIALLDCYDVVVLIVANLGQEKRLASQQQSATSAPLFASSWRSVT